MTEPRFDTILLTGAAGRLGTQLRRGLAPLARRLRLTDRVTIADPQPHEDCFAADLSRDIWSCFGCHQGGDQLTLWSLATHQPLYAATKFLCQSNGLPIPWRT